MYNANGLIGPDGSIDEQKRNRLEGWLKDLARRIDSLSTDDDDTLNHDLPAGYTYLLQLIGHDLVDSVPSVGLSDTGALDPAPQARLIIKNARHRPLALDTLYGAGPEETSFAYHTSESSDQTSPRDRLFLNALPRLPHPALYCACHDIRRMPTDPLIADPRNDAHALLAQLTALFHLLHNQIVTLIGPVRLHSRNEGLYRRYLCARTVVTLIYRNIIRHDVLQRILHPSIYERYKNLTDASQLLDQKDGVPLEFSHGAFRFGHALVRSEYRINSDTPLGVHLAISRTSQRELCEGPLDSDWLIDWARFFAPTAARASSAAPSINFAHTIGPQYSVRLGMHDVAPPKDPVRGQGLAYRDLRSAAYAGMWSVPALCSELRRKGLQDIVPEYGALKARIETWLGEGFDAAAREAIANDPPLPFFVLFEAAQSTTRDVKPGHRLGPVGSILVAEAVYGALVRHPTGFETALRLTDRIKDCCGALLGKRDVLSRAAASSTPPAERNIEIENMPQLLQFMADNGAFAAAPPPVQDV